MSQAAAHSSSAAPPPQFDAEMAALYSKISKNHEHPKGPWPLMLVEVLAAVKGVESPKILDVASGMGEPALSIAKALPNSSVLATDVSPDMIQKANMAFQGFPNVTAQVANAEGLSGIESDSIDVVANAEDLSTIESDSIDVVANAEDLSAIQSVVANAEDLSTIESDSIDVVTCCYGYMFPADKVKALKETLRVLKPGGVMIATSWDKIDLVQLVRDIMAEVLGAPPPPPPLNPMSLSEPGLFENLMKEAGFDLNKIKQSTSTYPFNMVPPLDHVLNCKVL
eukprot:gene28615-31785_t